MKAALRRSLLVLFTALLALTLAPAMSWAVRMGNPHVTHQAGDVGAGLSISQLTRTMVLSSSGGSSTEDLKITRTTVNLDVAAKDGVVLRVYLGNGTGQVADLDPMSGSEYGVGVRVATSGGGDFETGLLLDYITGSWKKGTDEVDYTQLNIGFGGATRMGNDAMGYVAAVYSPLFGTYFPYTGSIDFETESALGLVGGISFSPSQQLTVEAELHLLFESGFVLGATFLF